MNCQFETLNNLSKIKTSDFSEALVDDQGLEVAYMSLKPSKERRLSDIIFVQYSNNTQKYPGNTLFRLVGKACF